MGDPAGIGPEITIKALLAEPPHARPWILGCPTWMASTAKQLGIEAQVTSIEPTPGTEQAPITTDDPKTLWAPDFQAALNQMPDPAPNELQVIHCADVPPDTTIGRVQAACGRAAYDAIRTGIALAMRGQIAGLITAPIHKEALAAAAIPYPGHTEMLAELSGTPSVGMMLANPDLRVILVTIHCSMREAIEQITQQQVLTTIKLADSLLKQVGISAGRIAVAGLNPHAGEGGLFGDEEIHHIIPAIEQAREQGIQASGPWPGDTVFMRARGFRDFDIVVAMYHDQGLIPVKYLGLDEGVNVTVGLPFLRVSVDHGTAFDIAGRGLADPRSLQAALAWARQVNR